MTTENPANLRPALAEPPVYVSGAPQEGNFAPVLLRPGGGFTLMPPKRPADLEEAGAIAQQLLR